MTKYFLLFVDNIGIICNDVFGDDWTDFRIAHTVTSDGIGVEMFESSDNEPVEQFNFKKKNRIVSFFGSGS